MTSATDLIAAVEANGGRLSVEDGWLIVAPKSAGVPLLEQLRACKPEILALLTMRNATRDSAEPVVPSEPQHYEDLGVPPDHDLNAWKVYFERWRAERTVSRPGRDDAGGVGCLLVDFCLWAVQHDGIPATRGVFERLLIDAGFSVTDGMAGGIVLRGDLRAHSEFSKHTRRILAADAVRAAEKSKKES